MQPLVSTSRQLRRGQPGLALVLLLTLGACGQRPPAGDNLTPDAAETVPAIEPGVSLALAEHRAQRITNLEYSLHLVLPAARTESIVGNIVIEFELADANEPLQLDFQEDPARIGRLRANGADTAWFFSAEHVVVPATSLVSGPNRIDIELDVGDRSLNRNTDFLYTLFVPDRARTAWPLFDQPDLKARFQLTLDVPAEWEAVSNAPVESAQVTGDRKQLRFARSQLISSYLFSFAAGRFETLQAVRNGRPMTMFHREPDPEKVSRNADAIFDLHAAALNWLEDYTGIDYPWEKFDFVLIPAFQYGGMEHTGAIQYRASRLMLDATPSEPELLSRASVIAHETAHMWFGNLVTMRWFDDVWTKEVFANFMAAKIVNPSFPGIDHDLNFLSAHYPAAYAVDRSAGANAIRQVLPNLNEAGQMYGPIIYDKAPIMMRQLEMTLGEAAFRQGLQQYLSQFAYRNASWPELIAILDPLTTVDLAAWSDVWVNTPGRPAFSFDPAAMRLSQTDPAGAGRTWPQQFDLLAATPMRVNSSAATLSLEASMPAGGGMPMFDVSARGYGLFPARLGDLARWDALDDVARGALLVNLYENVLDGNEPDIPAYFEALLGIATTTDNQIILDLALRQLSGTWVSLLESSEQTRLAAAVEQALWENLLTRPSDGARHRVFESFAALAATPEGIGRLQALWSGALSVPGLVLSERDFIQLAATLAIRLPAQAATLIAAQLERIENPDDRRRLEFAAPALSASTAVREAFFASLAEERHREVESWVLEALGYLHHPSRLSHSEQFIGPSLNLLADIQRTGDIFFPTHWLNATLGNHSSASAAATLTRFLDEHPELSGQLRMKVLQAADMLYRANRL